MKLVINYDFFKKICNVNEPYSALKIIKNDKRKYVLQIPTLITINSILVPIDELPPLGELLSYLGIQLGLLMILNTLPELITHKVFNYDSYKEEAESKLKDLLSQLKDLYINTDFDLLLKSELYKKQYQIKLNEKKLPYILESKYIMVPTYDSNGKIMDTSFLQEHVVGSDEYVLSLGSPTKVLKLAYSSI